MKKDEYISQINAWSNLPDYIENDECIRLIKEYKMYGDESIRDKIVFGNMRFIAFYINSKWSNIVNKVTSIYPSYEDLFQEGIVCCVKAIKNFDTEYNFTFPTYLAKYIDFRCHYIIRSIKKSPLKKTVSLNAPIKKSKGKQDEDGVALQELIQDYSANPELLHKKLEWKYINEKLISLLSKKEQDIFKDYFISNIPQDKIASKHNLSQMSISRTVKNIQERIIEMYTEGVKESDLFAKGLKKDKKLEIEVEKMAIIKKYGKNFLVNCFIPSLLDEDKKVFEIFLFGAYGQTYGDIGKQTKMSANEVCNVILKTKHMFDIQAGQMYEKYKQEHPRSKSLSVIQEINRTQRLIDEYGGKLFLKKYFLSILPPKEKEFFNERFLNYEGDSKKDICQRIGIAQGNFSNMYNRLIAKLKSTDFEVLVNLVDNSNKNNVQTIESDQMALLKKRALIVKENGGILKLKEFFVPILTDVQKKVFDCLYLNPKYATITAMSKEEKMCSASLILAEKAILEKLKTTNISELIKIREKAEMQIRTNKNEIKNKEKVASIIKKYGGEEFIRAVFVPTLEVKSYRIIFVKSYLEGKSEKEILEELKLPHKAKDYLKRTKLTLLTRLKAFKDANPDFDKDVQDFYAKKEFERLHPENFEEVAFKVEKEEQEVEPIKPKTLDIWNVGREKDVERRRAFINEYLASFGPKKEVVRKFMPTLKIIAQQQVFLGFFLECKLDEEIRKELGLSAVDLKSVKTSIVNHLENFAKARDFKSNKNKPNGKTK